MSCGDKIKSRCGGKIYATCLYYEEILPSWSELFNEDCVVQSEVNDEIYTELTTIREKIDVSALTSSCFSIDTNDDNLITVKTALTTLVREMDGLLCPDPLSIPNDINISGWNLDFDCLSA